MTVRKDQPAEYTQKPEPTPKIQNYNPLNSGGWNVTFSRFPHLRFFCTSVTLPGLSVQNTKYETPYGPFPVPGSMLENGSQSISLTFMIDEDMNNWLELVRLAIAMGFPRDFNQYKVFFDRNTEDETFYTDMGVVMLDNMQRPLLEIIYKDCILKSVGDLSLSLPQTGQEPEPVTCTCTWEYAYFEVHQLNMAGKPYTLSDITEKPEEPGYNTKGRLFGDDTIRVDW